MNSVTDIKTNKLLDYSKIMQSPILRPKNTIEWFIESQIKDFLKENNISQKSWDKRGVIQSLPPEICAQSYILYFKRYRKEYKRKITVNYNF